MARIYMRRYGLVWRQDRAIRRDNPCAAHLMAAIKACGSLGDVDLGREIHRSARESGDLSSIFVSTALIDMYSRCRAMADAQDVFDTMDLPDVVAWNALITAYVDNGQSKLALELFFRLERPSSRSFVAAAMACVDLAAQKGEIKLEVLEVAMAIHCRARQMELEREIFVGNAMVNLYAKCGSLIDARRVFDENGEFATALELFSVAAFRDARTVVAVLMACGSLALIDEGLGRHFFLEKTMEIHARFGSQGDIFVENTLVDAYAKGGSLTDSRKVFDTMELHSVVSWNALILGLVENGQDELALELFEAFCREGLIRPDARTFAAAAMACAGSSAREESRELDGKLAKPFSLEKAASIHHRAQVCGFDSDIFVANALVDLYAKCGSMADATKVFRCLRQPDVVSWTSLLQGYAEDGGGELALDVFRTMEQASGCILNSRAFVAALMACSRLAAEEQGTIVDERRIKIGTLERAFDLHSLAVRHLPGLDIFVGNALVNLYSVCGFMLGSRTVFDRMEIRDVVSWNSLLLGYVDNGESSLALELFDAAIADVEPSSRTFIAALAACADQAAREDGEAIAGKLVKLKSLDKGMDLHSRARRCPWWESNPDTFFANSLFNMYSKCGCMDDARRVFDRGQTLDRVTWKHLVQAYVDNGENELALELFTHAVNAKMDGCDAEAMVAGVMACGNLVNFESGKWIHAEIYRLGYEKFTEVVTSLVSFYSKCGGRMVNAQHVFDQTLILDSVLWNSLICGYSREGKIQVTLRLLDGMREEGFHPDGVTFLSILTACCHAGLVGNGEHVFHVMREQCGIVPSVQHYTCMVDLLARSNQPDKAFQLVERMPHRPDRVTWTTLLSASRLWGDAGPCKTVFEEVLTQNRGQSASYYSLMANIMK